MTNVAVAPAIELVNATKRYGDSVALDGVSFSIDAGEFFCLLGPSGCGKSTTLNVIGGFIPLTSGELRIEGHRVDGLPPYKRNVNTVFQNYALFPHMTVGDNVAFGLQMERLPTAETATRVNDYLALVGLSGLRDRHPAQLSGGQQQRVALARALAKRPAVLLLDEPLGALDLKFRRQMQGELSRIHQQVGTTFVFVTHDQEEALSMATRIAVMSQGRVSQIGTPREVYYRPVNRFVADFIGESNFLEGDIQVEEGEAWFVTHGAIRIPAPRGSLPGATTLMVRPEAVEIGPASAASPAAIPGRIQEVTFMGDFTRITVQTAAGILIGHRQHQGGAGSAELQASSAQDLRVWWPPDAAIAMVDN